MKHKHFLKCGLLAFLLMAMAVIAVADPARVISKQENLPHVDGDLMTRVFLDITPDDNNDRADAYVDLPNTNFIMSMQEFSHMIQAGDVFEYTRSATLGRNGRYSVILFPTLVELNGENLYKIFVENFGDANVGQLFMYARKVFQAQNSGR